MTDWPYTNEAAAEFGRLFAELRRVGRPMQQIDIQIAAIAHTVGNCTVVSTASDLAAVPGLAVENWRAGAETRLGRRFAPASRMTPDRHLTGVPGLAVENWAMGHRMACSSNHAD